MDYYEAMETYSRIGLLRRYWKLTVVLNIRAAQEETFQKQQTSLDTTASDHDNARITEQEIERVESHSKRVEKM